MKRIQPLVIGFCLALAAGGQVPLAHTYEDATEDVRVSFPEGWRIDPKSTPFTIVSFDPERRPPQVLVPLDGAQIVVTRPLELGIESIADWMRVERIQPSRGYAITKADLVTKDSGKISATIVRSEPSVIPKGVMVVYLFQFEGRPLKVALTYRGKGRAEYFENVLLAVVKSLAPSSRTAR